MLLNMASKAWIWSLPLLEWNWLQRSALIAVTVMVHGGSTVRTHQTTQVEERTVDHGYWAFYSSLNALVLLEAVKQNSLYTV